MQLYAYVSLETARSAIVPYPHVQRYSCRNAISDIGSIPSPMSLWPVPQTMISVPRNNRRVLVSNDFPKRRGRLRNRQLEAECVIRYTYSVLSIQKKLLPVSSRTSVSLSDIIFANLPFQSYFSQSYKNPFIKTAGGKSFPPATFTLSVFSPDSLTSFFFLSITHIHFYKHIQNHPDLLVIVGTQTESHYSHIIV